MPKLPSYVAPANICISFVKPVSAFINSKQTIVLGSLLTSFLLLLLSMRTTAQCNVFQDADAANPVLSALQPGETITSLDFTDIDGDGDLDCYIVQPSGAPRLLRNVGTSVHPIYQPDANSGFAGVLTPEGAPVIQFTDIDGDGDEDCFITEISFDFRPVTTIRFYRNTGSRTSPQFTEDETNNPVDFARSGNNYVLFTFADIDNDGDEDLYYTGFYNTTYGDYDQFTYLNTGTANAPSYTLYSNDHPHDFQRQRTYFDWNKDGLPDYIAYDNTQNHYSYYQNTGPLQQPHYIKETTDAPQFQHGLPYRLVDLNNDKAPESFTANGSYATVSPVSVIKQTTVQHYGISFTRLSSDSVIAGNQYHWEINGKPLQAGSHPVVYAPVAGTYVLYVSNECGTGVSLPVTITGRPWMFADNNKTADETTSALSEIAKPVIEVKAYPNPFTDYVTIQLPRSSTAIESRIVITDMAGRVQSTGTTKNAHIKAGQGLQRGMYVLQVWQKDQLVYHTKLLKE